MTAESTSVVAIWSYGLATVAYLALVARMGLGWQRSWRAGLLLGAALATALWAAANVAVAMSDTPFRTLLASVFDTLRYGAWFAFVASLSMGAGDNNRPIVAAAAIAKAPTDGQRTEAARPAFPASVVGLVAIALLISLLPPDSTLFQRLGGGNAGQTYYALRLGLAVFGLVQIEQLLRRALPPARWAIKPLAVAVAGMFGYELFMYADAMLFSGVDLDMWAARGFANAILVPFIAIAMARNPRWTVEMHLSRQVVVRSTALLVSAAFLLIVAGAGFIVRYLGGDWGRALQIEVLFAALVVGAFVASSGRFRAKLRVFVSKHFFSYRYDYREEWLRFTGTLLAEQTQSVQERVITALAVLVESPAGMLWLRDANQTLRPEARWNMPLVDATESIDSSLGSFLSSTQWVVNVPEAASAPQRYPGLELPAWLRDVAEAWLLIPLISASELLGFVLLTTPRTTIDVNWEVRDVLKTASSQAASYLVQLRATDALLEARKFDAFNRMSAFVVHDLKNLVAQLSLMLRNAERHRDNPEFQRDMLSTVAHVVERMNKLMLQLRTGATPVENARPVDLEVIVRAVCAAKAKQGAQIELELASGIMTLGHEDRLEHVIGHLVQNAVDATARDATARDATAIDAVALDAGASGGRVNVRLYRDGVNAVIEVNDTGIGMTQQFVRERLFKPFETTKSAGMGIGVYESSQYVAGLGGNVAINSEPGRGTRVRVLLPAIPAIAQAEAAADARDDGRETGEPRAATDGDRVAVARIKDTA